MLQPQFRAPFRVLERVFVPFLQAPKQPSQFLQQRTSITAPHNITPLHPSRLGAQFRYASHATQGAANAHSKNSPGRRLGAKKTGEQYVIPGNIIFRQRGTKWFPGENCGIGRDHTIYALQTGYVKYYRDPQKHPTRKYIGVAFAREDVLPYPRNAPTKRRLGMVAAPMPVEDVAVVPEKSATPPLRPGYQYREGNWEIGRLPDKAGITVKEWRRKDRWTAWRKKTEKIKRVAQMKDLKNRKKTKVKAKQ
ncbi:ribosomal protein L27 [Coccidioides immitis RS]|uniref:Large ribosomal subunit protein bL27m n=3 Tax=Coccidioides immitis TaxID=5501 RepID=A0A0J8QRM8_COCIT|nr:ribosomal protein L27 [Coccidioides immitis RS]KMP03775.1 60S ribosomal protein L2 [Coccidioides immitis RMSCC 2394]KMU74750.1 60S ribosomal protein L2 [Coccidioides immitis RMSCC 3703]KMU83279.1 60S ribosomal protein L2 [Coccidioides immitis H538.4]TPX24009.1 54S ribosomal protein L2 mitochondrial [Coccidioides immitis]EAS31162.3 ribosomal protein L27 [Coccidioides immitis RS]